MQKGKAIPKQFLSIMSAITVIAVIFNFKIYAAENAEIIKAIVTDTQVSAYINIPDVSDCTAMLGTQECEVRSCMRAGDMPSDTLILVDTSGSIPQDIQDKTSQLLEMLIDGKNENERYAIAAFGIDIDFLCELTSDRYELIKAVEKIKYDQKYTHIYSVLDTSLGTFAKDVFGKIVVISDGVENSKDGITYDEILISVSSADIPVYTVGIENNNQESLKKLYAFSRNSSAKSCTLSADADISSMCGTINSFREYSRINIEIPQDCADGSLKYLKLTGSGFECGCDVRMPSIAAVQTETQPVSVETSFVQTESVISAESKAPFNIYIIFIAAGAIILIAGAVIAVFKLKNKPKKSENTAATHEQDNISTVIGTVTTVDTDCALKMVDINAPEHSFRCAVGEGVIIGRSAKQCMIVIDYDDHISRRHCRIYRSGDKFYIENLSERQTVTINDNCTLPVVGSAPQGGTRMLIHGAATMPVSDTYTKEIVSGDIIKLGHTSLRVEFITGK